MKVCIYLWTILCTKLLRLTAELLCTTLCYCSARSCGGCSSAPCVLLTASSGLPLTLLLFVQFWDWHWWQRFCLPFPPSRRSLKPSLLLCVSVASFFISCHCMHICICIYICILKYKLFSQYNATSVYVFWADCGTGQVVCSSLVRTAHFDKFMAVLILILWLVEPSCPLFPSVHWALGMRVLAMSPGAGLHSSTLGLPVLFCRSVSIVERSFLDEGWELLHLSVVQGQGLLL